MDNLLKIKDCVYYKTCVQGALYGKVHQQCPCYLIGATKVVTQIKKDLQTKAPGKEVV